MNSITVVMQWEKETKNTHKYSTMDPASPVKEVYLQKSHLAGAAAPKTVKVTVAV